MILDFFSTQSSLTQAWVWTMVHSIWIGLVLAMGYHLFLITYKGNNAALKYYVGLGLLCLLPTMALVMWWLTAPTSSPLSAIVDSSTPAATYGLSTASEALYPSVSWMDSINRNVQAIFMVWCAGVLIMSFRMIWGYKEIVQLRRSTSDIDTSGIQELFKSLLATSGIRRHVALVQSAIVQVPMTVGYLHPMVILPLSLINQLSFEETKAILAHELGHILRKDYLQNLVISGIEILFFFHPSVWWFVSTLKSLREQCSDDLALQMGAEPIALSKALVHLEEQSATPVLALAFSGNNLLLHRIKRLFHSHIEGEYRLGRSQAHLVLGGLAFIWLLGTPMKNILSENQSMSLLKSFIWEKPLVQVDTTKPKVKIEKITKDNGKQKLELRLEDQILKELRVNDQVIPPKEYEKYQLETEALRLELKEIELPAARTKIYRSPAPDVRDHYSFDFDFNDKFEDHDAKIIKMDKMRTDAKIWSKQPNNKSGHRDEYFFYDRSADAPIRIKSMGRAFGSGSGENIKYIIEGDSSGIIIDTKNDQLILKDLKGDIILNLTPGRDLRFHGDALGWSNDRKMNRIYELLPRGQQDLLLEHALAPDAQIRIEKEFKEKWSLLDEDRKNLMAKQQLNHAKLADEMRWNKDKLLEEMARSGGGDAELKAFRNGKLDQIIQGELMHDRLVSVGDSYEFKITAKELKVNGKKQDAVTHRRYKALVEDHTGIPIGEKTIIEYKTSGKTNNK